MSVLQKGSDIPGPCHQSERSPTQSSQHQESLILASTDQSNRSEIISGTCIILPPIHSWLCSNIITTHRSDPQSKTICLDRRLRRSLQLTEASSHKSTTSCLPRFWQKVLLGHRRLPRCRGSSPLPDGRWKRSSSCLLQPKADSDPTQMVNLRPGTLGNCLVSPPLQTLPQRPRIYHPH